MVQRSPITQKALDALNPAQLAVVKWQYRLHGSFYTALWKAIEFADESNLDSLRLGFYVEVSGYRLFRDVPGWWQDVEEKVAKINAEVTQEEENKG